MARTIGALFSEARTLLQDKDGVNGFRYSNDELMEAFNGAMMEARSKRPDLFIDMGLRAEVPFYDASLDLAAPFPLSSMVYPAFVYYVVGRCELREDTFSEDSRAVALMNKFVSQLTTVTS